MRIWEELTALNREVPEISFSGSDSFDLKALDETAAPNVENIEKVISLEQEWDKAVLKLSSMPRANSERTNAVDANLRLDLQQAMALYSDFRLRLYLNAVKPFYQETEILAESSIKEDLDSIRAYALEPPERHPSRAVAEKIVPIRTQAVNSQEQVDRFIVVMNDILEHEPPISSPGTFIDLRSKAESLNIKCSEYLNELDAIGGQADKYEVLARKALARGLNALKEARTSLSAGRSAVERGKDTNDIEFFYKAIDYYKAASVSLESVEAFYGEVLVNDFDIAADSGLLEELTLLKNQSSTEQANVAVAVKENAISEARNAYSAQNYMGGIALLNQSQSFWERIYGETDPEIRAWSIRLKNAYQSLQQTVIEPNDPLFSEMNQYLNLANRYFLEGVRLSKAGNSSDSLRSFRSAEELLDQVLLPFPGNEAALLLKQQILRKTDYDAWAKGAQALIRDVHSALAQRNISAFLGSSDKKGLYADLLVLRKIDPGFAGLKRSVNYNKGLIYDVEVLIGRVQPPPDPRAIARSRELTSKARKIWDNFGTEGASQALELLDKALDEWLDNTDASRLRREIVIQKTPAPIPVELQGRLVYFDQFFAEGDYVTASLMMDQILKQFPRFAKDPRITNRQKMMEARQ